MEVGSVPFPVRKAETAATSLEEYSAKTEEWTKIRLAQTLVDDGVRFCERGSCGIAYQV